MSDKTIYDYQSVSDTRRQYMQAIFEGKWATADYLLAYLPPVDMSDVICPPGDLEGRETWSCSGEIG